MNPHCNNILISVVVLKAAPIPLMGKCGAFACSSQLETHILWENYRGFYESILLIRGIS